MILGWLGAEVLCAAAETDIGQRDEHYARCVALIAEADSLLRMGALDSAANKAETALVLARRDLVGNDTIVVEALATLGAINWNMLDYSTAEQYWQQSLGLRAEISPADDPDLAQNFADLGSAEYMLGRFDSAAAHYERALPIFKQVLGERHHTVAIVLGNLAALRADQGRFALAEPLFHEAIAIREAELGANHPSVAAGLRELGNAYFEQGRHAEAEEQYNRALEIQNQVYLPSYPNSPEIGKTLNSLGSLYSQWGRYVDAEQCLLRAQRIFDESLGDDHPDIAQSWMDLAALRVNQNRLSEADSLLTCAQNMYDRLYHGASRKGALCAENLAILKTLKGDFNGADTLLQRVIDDLDSLLPGDHPQKYRCREQHALVLSALGLHREAIDEMAQAHRATLDLLIEDGALLPERVALQYAQGFEIATDHYLTILLNGKDDNALWRQDVANVVVSSKGIVTQLIAERNKKARGDADSELGSARDSLRDARYRLATLHLNSPTIYDGAHGEKLAAAAQEKERLEGRVVALSGQPSRTVEGLHADWRAISEVVPEDVVLIDFFRYHHHQSALDSGGRCLAVVWKQADAPVVVELGSADSIESAVSWYRSHLDHFSSEDPADYGRISSELYRLIWQPVEDFIGDSRAVFIAPDGELHLLSFAGLQAPSGRFLIEDFAIHYLASARDVAATDLDSEVCGTGLISFGDPDFDCETPLQVPETVRASLVSLPSDWQSKQRTAKKWDRLPGTKEETARIVSDWTDYMEAAVSFCGCEATESRFNLEAPGRRLIHVATHGYYVGAEQMRGRPSTITERRFVAANPLLSSRLVFAGANRGAACSDDDGLLTAEEIVALDFSGTELVLLSACETGLGDIKAGEGVFGLSRAFLYAGARSVVSTLWRVPDQDSAGLVARLLVDKRRVTPSALQQAMIARLNDLRVSGSLTHPYFWAGFALAGAWE